MPIETWKFINSFAPWFSAIGTFFAVALSLYFSYTSRRIKLKVTSDIYEYNEEGVKNEYIIIQITNEGFRDVSINNCIFQFGRLGKTNIGIGQKHIDPSKSCQFPYRLEENTTTHLAIKLNQKNDYNYLQNLFNNYLDVSCIKSLRIVVYPNVGKPFKGKLGKTIQAELNKIAKKTT